jgi:pimeloyl-ACP methyl ester carboxylesterase
MAEGTRYARTSDDVQIAYWTMGSGVPLLFSPQPMFTSAQAELEITSSRKWYERLARDHMVVRFDHRGSGGSDRDVTDFSMEAFGRDLAAVVTAVGADVVDLWAQEDAAPLAVAFAADNPERVRNLVLWGAWAEPSDVVESPAVRALEDLIEHNFPMWLESAMSVIWRWPGDEGRAYARALQDSFSADNARAYVRSAWEWNVSHLYDRIACPTLVINRRDQPIFPAEAGASLAARIKGSKRVVVEGDSQLPWVGDSEACLRIFEKFVSGVAVEIVDTAFATVLFTDIVGSTELNQRVGDKQWAQMLDDYERDVRAEVHRFSGREIFTKGDEFLISFDTPARAVRCACAIREVARGHGFNVRSGLHAGEIELRGEDVSGVAVNIGARVSTAAQPDEVLVSRTVVDLLAGSDIEFIERGAFDLKGVKGSWQLFSVGS